MIAHPTRALGEKAYETYLAALLRGDRAECGRLVQELLARDVPVKDLYQHLFQRALYRVGELWENQEISVAVEHLATAITERMFTLVQPRVFAGPPRSRTIIVACAPNERHQIGARMIADLCELRGWRGDFLGADTSISRLLTRIDNRKPSLLALSVALPTCFPSLIQAIDAVTAAYPGLPILAGGQAFRYGIPEELDSRPAVRYLRSFEEVEAVMASYGR